MTVVQHLAPMGYFDKTVEHDAVAEVTGASLRYADVGSGEPVILIHGTSLADGVATPLRHYDPLYDDFRILSYYRAGYSGSLLHQEGCSIELGAQHIVELLDHVGVDRAHMVAFSAGGVMGLEALMRYPDRFATAVLLEPWLPREDPVAVEAVNTAGMTAYGKFAEGDLPGAARYWLEAVGGTSFLSCIDVYGPKDVWKRVEADLTPTFYIDAAALGAWGFTPSKAAEYADRKPMMPILNVLAHDSEAILPGFRETFRFLLEWLPHAERAGIPNATHGMQTMNPLAVGALIHDFLSRHPISSGA